MGYYINHLGGKFQLKKEHFAAALEAIQVIVYRRQFETIHEAFEYFDWNPLNDQWGNINSLGFTGEKAGDEDRLFAAIAPFVEHGSYIECSGSDDALWQWRFVNGTMEIASAEIVWPPFPEQIKP